MENLREFATSANGDRWLLGKDNVSGEDFVLHRAICIQGDMKHAPRCEPFSRRVPRRLNGRRCVRFCKARGLEGASKLDEEKTPSVKRAHEYLSLGGTRRAKVDDNIVSTRKGEDEPAEAEAFWDEKIEPLDDKQRQKIEIQLPSISDD